MYGMPVSGCSIASEPESACVVSGAPLEVVARAIEKSVGGFPTKKRGEAYDLDEAGSDSLSLTSFRRSATDRFMPFCGHFFLANSRTLSS